MMCADKDTDKNTDKEKGAFRAVFASDFDGTLLRSDKTITHSVYEALDKLADFSVARVIATGRSLYSLFGVIDRDFPVEYIIFSSGAGILRMSDKTVLRSRGFDPQETERISEMLIAKGFDFMIHHPIPENHHFYYHYTGGENDDFFRRCEHYADYAYPLGERNGDTASSQFLIVEPVGEEEKKVASLRREFGERASVVRATSPLDHSSVWIEIFPPHTDKGSGLEELTSSFGLGQAESAAVGNDYNDLHMLEWAQEAFVVANAPEELRRRFRTVASCDENGFAEAADIWLTEKIGGVAGTGEEGVAGTEEKGVE